MASICGACGIPCWLRMRFTSTSSGSMIRFVQCRRSDGFARRGAIPAIGVRFAEAAVVFEDPVAITVIDDESDPLERRSITLGGRRRGANTGVVYSWRGDDIRLISARRAKPHEREEYEK